MHDMALCRLGDFPTHRVKSHDANEQEAPMAAKPKVTKRPYRNTARSDGLKRVHWNPMEVDLLVSAAARAVYEGRATTPLKALRIAEKSLPDDRHRGLDTLTGISWFAPRLLEARNALAQADLERLAAKKTEEDRLALIDAEADRIGRSLTAGSYVSASVDGVVGQLRGLIVKELAGLLVEAVCEAARQLQSPEAAKLVLSPLVAALLHNAKSNADQDQAGS